MSAQRAWLALAGASVLLLLAVSAASLFWLGPGTPTPAAGMAFAIVGALLTVRRPENPVGGLLVAIGVFWSLGEAAYIYPDLNEVRAVPAPELGAWLHTWVFYPVPMLVTAVVVLFPSGRIAATRMRWFLRALAATGIVTVVTRMVVPLSPDQQAFGPEFANNPWALELLAPFAPIVQALDYLIPLFLVLAVIDLVTRWRRYRGVERLQMRWIALALVVFAVLLIAALAVEATGVAGERRDLVWDAAWLLGQGSLPVAIGFAILRYRLYDIDRIISRTLAYALLSATLAATYFAFVVGLQALLRPATGSNDYAIVVTTLIVAALFLPLRSRMQRIVDRRFNRSAYNATQTVEAFNIRLREQIDLDTLRYELLAVVGETMQPARASLWLREPGGGR